MATRYYKVMVDQFGHSPAYMKGDIIAINDDDPDAMTATVGEGAPVPWTGDIAWAVEQGAVVEVDENGNVIEEKDRQPIEPRRSVAGPAPTIVAPKPAPAPAPKPATPDR